MWSGRVRAGALACIAAALCILAVGALAVDTSLVGGALVIQVRVRVRVNKDPATRATAAYLPTLVRIPVGATENMTVRIDWGDNTTAYTQSVAPLCHAGTGRARCLQHYYRTWGNYTIRVESLYREEADQAEWQFGWHDLDTSWKDDAELVDVLGVAEWSIPQLTSLDYAFASIRRPYASHMYLPDRLPPRVQTLRGVFYGCAYCNNANVSGWNVADVTDTSDMFASAHAFNQPLAAWNVARVTSMRNMFQSALSFNRDISSWDTRNVTDMSGAFWNAAAFNVPIGAWDTSQVTTMRNMFNAAVAFNRPIGSWDTRRVQRMEGMFQRALRFDQDISRWDVSSCVGFDYMFIEATRFARDLTHWNVSRVTGRPLWFADRAPRFSSDLWPRFYVPSTPEELERYHASLPRVPVEPLEDSAPAPPASWSAADEAWKILHDPAMAYILDHSPLLKTELEKAARNRK